MRHGPSILAAAVLGVFTLACVGGAATGEVDYGNPEGGVWLGDASGAASGGIAVASDGSFIAWRHQPDGGAGRLAIGYPDDGRTVLTSVVDPVRLAFARRAPIVYVVHGHGEGGLLAFDVGAGVQWEVPLPAVDLTAELDVSGDGRFLLLHRELDAAVIDANTGETLHVLAFERPLRDADILADDRRVVFVELEEWVDGAPRSRVSVLDVDEGRFTASFDIPNCGARLEVVPSTMRGFLAPTWCAEDPVSVLSLTAGAERFERNLPGFGPVSIAPDGATVVAFYDHALSDPELFDDPEQIPGPDDERYHLMLIDSEDLTFDLLPWGDRMPRYTIDRAGDVVLVDSAMRSAPTLLLDVAERRFRPVEGPQLALDVFGFSPDSQQAHVLQGAPVDEGGTPAGLYALQLATGISEPQPVPFVPTSLNISPDGSSLFLRRDSEHVCVWDLAAERCRQTIAMGM